MISSMRAQAQGQEAVILHNSESETDVPVLLLVLSMDKSCSAESDCGATCATDHAATVFLLFFCFFFPDICSFCMRYALYTK